MMHRGHGTTVLNLGQSYPGANPMKHLLIEMPLVSKLNTMIKVNWQHFTRYLPAISMKNYAKLLPIIFSFIGLAPVI